MVGFNRRFAPMAGQMKKFLAEIHEPLAIHYRVNAGYIPPDHWVNDPSREADAFWARSVNLWTSSAFWRARLRSKCNVRWLAIRANTSLDKVVASLKFANGTLGTISYLANGDKSASKERVEVFGGGSVAILEDFRRLELVRGGESNYSRSLGAGQGPQE